jgi:hypothetical protein
MQVGLTVGLPPVTLDDRWKQWLNHNWQGKTEVIGERLLQNHFVRLKSHIVIEPRPPRWEADEQPPERRKQKHTMHLARRRYFWYVAPVRLQAVITGIVHIMWGTALYAGRSRVRIFHWPNPSGRTNSPGVDSTCNRNEYQGYIVSCKCGRCEGWQPYHLQVPTV